VSANKTVLITGTAGTPGTALSRAFANDGANAAAGRQEAEGTKLVASLDNGPGPGVLVM
jgi:NAD(P)-dependent dehydrogenase (short-subunit alcohol dehydrogenase family)